MQEVGAIMKDSTHANFTDQLLGHRDSGNASVVVPNRVGDTGFLNCFDHILANFGIQSEWLFAKNHLASFSGCDGEFSVRIVWQAKARMT